MWGLIEDTISRAKALDYIEGFSFVLNLTENQSIIIELNQQQLWDGVNSQGVSLDDIGGAYKPFTIQIKQATGLPTDRTTLFQTGEYYSSYDVHVDKSGFTITSNPIKDDDNLEQRYGTDLMGMTEQSVERLIEQIAGDFIKWLTKTLMQ